MWYNKPMAAYSNPYRRPDPAKQAEFLAEINNHRDVSVAEFAGLISIEEVVKVDEFQTTRNTQQLLAAPVPDWLIQDNPAGAAALTNNTTFFDDTEPAMEDLIADDPIIKGLLGQNSSEEKAAAIRTRRSVITLIIKHASEQEENTGPPRLIEPDPKPTQQESDVA
jgi:hypothetical protein